MAKLEEITVGSHVLGISGDEPVSIVAIQWYGTNVIEITYKASSSLRISRRSGCRKDDYDRIIH